MKKIFGLLVILLMGITLFSGCGVIDDDLDAEVFQLETPEIDCGDITGCKS